MSSDSNGLNDALVETFLQESGEILEGATNAILALGTASNPRPFINQLFRDFHSIKGNAALFGLEHAKTLAHELEPTPQNFLLCNLLSVQRLACHQ